jgi:hypothetical protein
LEQIEGGRIHRHELQHVRRACFDRSHQLVDRYLAVDVTLRNCHYLEINIRSFEMQRFKNARNIVSALSPKPVFF